MWKYSKLTAIVGASFAMQVQFNLIQFIKPFTVQFLEKRLQNYDNLHEWAQSTCVFREPRIFFRF